MSSVTIDDVCRSIRECLFLDDDVVAYDALDVQIPQFSSLDLYEILKKFGCHENNSVSEILDQKQYEACRYAVLKEGPKKALVVFESGRPVSTTELLPYVTPRHILRVVEHYRK
jgi:hypothetical protein